MRNFIYLTIVLVFSFGCKDKWDEAYSIQSDTVNENLWDVLKSEADYSEFVDLVSTFGYDSILRNPNSTYTLFIPNNLAIKAYKNENEDVTKEVFKYHLINHFIQTQDIDGERSVLTVLNKYVIIENNSLAKRYNNIEITKESPLYINGRFFEIKEVAKPTDNIFQYLKKHNPELAYYILNFDSVILDYENSKPIGINDFGEIIYDSVSFVNNSFEEMFFPIREEFRNRFATFALPGIQNYNKALDMMAQNIGGDFIDHSDIPEVWKTKILIPYLFEHGAFDNKIEANEFINLTDDLEYKHKLKNMLGDSVIIGYVPVDQQFCSNGYVFDYEEFIIPDSLYNNEVVFEAEWLVDAVGFKKYAWNELAIVSSGFSTAPYVDLAPSQSNDSILIMDYPLNYKRHFSLEFKIKNVFPKKYLAVIGTKPIAGGIYNIYVNGKLMRTFDYNEYALWRQALPSVAGGRYMTDSKGFSKFDFWIENLTQFGDVSVKFEYVGPGKATDVKLMLDNLRFIPN